MAQITIIVPILNGEKFIKEFANSLKLLNFNFKILVIDGGSTDDSVNKLNQYLKGFDFEIHTQNNKGRIYGAMNQALKLVNTPYVVFYGIDDRFLENFNHLYSEALAKKPDMIYGGYKNINEGKTILHRFTKLHLLYKNICHQAIIYKTEIIEEFMYNDQYKVQADHFLNIQIFSKTNNILYLNKVVCNYDGGGFSSYTYDENFQKDFASIINHFFGKYYGILASIKKLLVKIFK